MHVWTSKVGTLVIGLLNKMTERTDKLIYRRCFWAYLSNPGSTTACIASYFIVSWFRSNIR